MKSRQRLEKRKQRFSEGWQQVVLKLPDCTTNSTALSPEITRSAVHGRTRTRHCHSCSIPLTEEVWSAGNAKISQYICKLCDSIKRKRNKLKEKARNISAATVLKFNSVKEGSVYVVGNPSWPEWVKVGMAIDADDRLKSYQTGSPFRDYMVYYSFLTKDRRKSEAEAHIKLERKFKRKNEWFKCSPEQAIEVLNE
jgi:hypothetical protein